MIRQYVEIKNDTIVEWYDVDESIFGGVDTSTMYPPPRFIEVLPPLRSKAAKYDPETKTVVEDLTKLEHAREFDLYHMRHKRDKILTDTDWTQGRDSPLSLDEKIKYAHYRTKLRDLTLSDAPFFVTWPTLEDAQDPWTLLREKRDILLENTDKFTTIDYGHATEEVKQAYVDYRQALRDLPANTEDPANPTWPTLALPTEIDPMDVLRRTRNELLRKTDHLAFPDYPHLSDQVRADWMAYRQALRDLPANTTDPENPTWPTEPSYE